MPDDIKDDASFQASLTTEQQKSFYTNALKTASEAAVTKFKTESEEARKKAIPEKYEIKFVDGSGLVQTDSAALATYAKEHGLTSEQAQKLAATVADRTKGIFERQQAAIIAERTKWAEDTKADKDLGGEKFESTMKHVKLAMDRFAPQGSKFRELMDTNGFGNHPEVVRVFSSIGKAMAEDKGLNGGDRVSGKKTWADRLYPAKSS